MKRTVKPLQNYVLVEKVYQKTTGLLDLDLSQVTDQNMFDVIIVDKGPDCVIAVSIGDMVECVSGNLAMPLPDIDLDDGEKHEFYIMREKDIVGKVCFSS